MRTISIILPLAALLGCLAAPATVLAQRAPRGGQAPGGTPSGPVQVGVITLHPQSVPITQQLPGRVSASQTADVRPQVGGVIKAIDFKAGQPVKAGDKLYEIYYRFLETNDEYFDYAPAKTPPQGRWQISGINLQDSILRKVYNENAKRELHVAG